MTPPPPSATPSDSTMVVDEEDPDPADARVSVSRGSAELPHPGSTQSLPQAPPKRIETRLLPQIIKEEMQELVIPPPIEPEGPRRPRKPNKTRKFVSTSRKGRLRMKNFANFHMPFGPERIPEIDLGTLEEALRKLGIETGS